MQDKQYVMDKSYRYVKGSCRSQAPEIMVGALLITRSGGG